MKIIIIILFLHYTVYSMKKIIFKIKIFVIYFIPVCLYVHQFPLWNIFKNIFFDKI